MQDWLKNLEIEILYIEHWDLLRIGSDNRRLLEKMVGAGNFHSRTPRRCRQSVGLVSCILGLYFAIPLCGDVPVHRNRDCLDHRFPGGCRHLSLRNRDSFSRL